MIDHEIESRVSRCCNVVHDAQKREVVQARDPHAYVLLGLVRTRYARRGYVARLRGARAGCAGGGAGVDRAIERAEP